MSLSLRTFTIVAAALLLTAIGAALPRTASADPLSCFEIDIGEALFGDQLLAALDEEIAGTEHRINRRKTLVLEGMTDISASGCELTLVADVTLERRLRRDAEGTMTLRTTVAVDRDGDTLVVELSRVRVVDFSLSHTLEIGEAVYRAFANRALPDRKTIVVELD